MSRNPKAKGRLLRTCRSVHSWLSVLVLPRVFVIGLTGFYLKHAKLVGALFIGKQFSESGFEEEVPPSGGPDAAAGCRAPTGEPRSARGMRIGKVNKQRKFDSNQ